MIVFELQVSNPGRSGFNFNTLFKTAVGAKHIAERHCRGPLEWKPGIHSQTEYAVGLTQAEDPILSSSEKMQTIYYIAPREVIE